MSEYVDGPLNEVANAAAPQVAAGSTVFQKWTCSRCGERITMDTPNVFFTSGKHTDCPVEPDCETDIAERGCNMLIITGNVALIEDAFGPGDEDQ